MLTLRREALRDLAQLPLYKRITEIFLLYHHRAFSNTISSMGIDSQGINRIVGSCGDSSELNDSGEQEAESQQEQGAEETIPESRTFRHRRKRTRVLRENYVPWHNIHEEM